MEFRKKLKTRLYVAISYIVFGLLMIGISLWKDSDYLSSLGLVFTIMGFARIRQYRRITRSEDSIKAREIAETDERNVMIWHKAKSLAFSICLMLACCTVIVLQIMGMTEQTVVMGYVVCGCLVVYWICYWYIRRKY